MSLAGKTALITGGSKGIGRAIALRLASLGAKVIVNYSSSPKAAEDVVSQITRSNGSAFAIKANAGSVPDIENLVKESVGWSGGKIDILIPCAGTMKLAELEKVTEEEYDSVMALNVKGVLFLVQKCQPFMSRGGRVILFSTSQAHASTVTPNYLVYCMSKGAIEQMTRLLSKDLARNGILVNCIAPGPIATDMFLSGKSDTLIKSIAGLNPQNRIGEPEEVATVAAFLSGQESSWVSGQTLRVNGGFV